jgi:hypothetical protein
MKKLYILFTMLLVNVASIYAQSPTDLQFVPQGNICAGITYGYSSWDHYWEGDTLRINGNVGDVTTQKIAGGFNLGILDRLNLIVMLPYVFTNTNSGTLNGQSGISDISFNVKGNYGEFTLGKGKLLLGGNLGFSFPVSKYLIDFGPLNIGAGTTNLSYRQLIKYKMDNGFYITPLANFTLRSNVPDIHRGEFYFDNGQAYYSNEVHVPNQFDWSLAVGYQKKTFLAELGYTSLHTLGGTDIRTWDAGFPTNKVNASAIYGRYDYYMQKPHGLNFSLVAGYTVAGRNTGKPFYAALSVNYLFGLWKKVAPVE